MSQQRRIHVIEGTHWDREWRFSYEATRVRLVRMMDNLLDIVEQDPGRRCYHLDGQSILLEDYLELRPENAARLKKACREKRILVGPWYTLPDENVILGESLVRNFLVGRRVCRDYGGAMPIGYCPTSYGQVSQIPQIMLGFGIDNIFFYRGINNVVAPRAEFLWEGADGSRLLAVRFSDYGRANFFHHVYRPLVYNRDRSKQQRRWEDGGAPFRLAGSSTVQPYELIEPLKGAWYPENAKTALAALMAQLDDNTTHLGLGMQTQDQIEPCRELGRLVEALNKEAGYEMFVVSSLPAFLEELRALKPELGVLHGEMRHTTKTSTITDLFYQVFASRPHVKQANRIAELELSRWCEPASAMAWLLGHPYPVTHLDRAWKLLLANHAHDSISGCSMDDIHKDTADRNRQVRIIAEEHTIRGLGRVAAAIDAKDLKPEDVMFVVFNPDPYARSEVVAAELDVNEDETFADFEVVDETGRPAPVQLRGEETKLTIFQNPYDLPLRMPARSRKLYFQAEGVPALGYRSWLLRRGGVGSLRKGSMVEPDGRTFSNGLLRVSVNPNGTWEMTDLKRGRTFSKLGLLEDDGEAGDPWVRVAPKEDRLVTSADVKAAVSAVEDGPLSATLSVRVPLTIPACVEGFNARRSARTVTLEVEHLLTLRAGSPRLDVVTRFNNTAEDHRLRIAFPTGLRGATCSAAETPFDVVERPIKVPTAEGWREPPTGYHPQLNFVDVSDQSGGLALLNLAITQYEVRDDEERTLALTFLRAYALKSTVRPALYPDQPGSQCLFPQEYRYALLPHAGNWQEANIPREAYRFLLPLRAAAAGRGSNGTLPRTASFVGIQPDALQLSAVKRSENGKMLVVRLWNPTGKRVAGRLECLREPVEARRLTMAEERRGKLKVSGRSVELRVKPKEVLTVGLTFAPESQ